MNQTILITGCSSGLGQTTALHFARQGWNVIATMRRPADAADFSEWPNVMVVRLDVEDAASIEAAIAAGIERFGRIDAVVNNAGFGLFGLFEATLPEKIAEQFAVNVFGAMNVMRAILPHFREHRSGTVVNVGSGAGVFGLPMLSLYCASKFALEGFSEAISYELASQGIRVKMIEPGGVTSTRFGERSGAEAAQNAGIADYESFVEATAGLFARMRDERRGTEEEVAQTIYAAVTDGTDRLRYVATKDILPIVQARRETSEEAFMAYMRTHYQPQC
ncbi:MAG: SDR family oxidoreductase [Verrucomicrobiota bacterium JB022]|nr:SDR family oxidoreductase [Verrucomicrobiota bacterium JB022]